MNAPHPPWLLQVIPGRFRWEAERHRYLEVCEQAPAFRCALCGPTHVFEIANAAYRRLYETALSNAVDLH